MLAKITVNTKIDDTSFCSTCGPYFQINDILTCPRQWCTFYNFQRAWTYILISSICQPEAAITNPEPDPIRYADIDIFHDIT